MSYIDTGYDEFFERSIASPVEELQSIDADVVLEGISGQSILSDGSIESNNGKLAINLNKNSFSINDGVVERIRLGQTDDGEYGLIIKDREGNVLFNITSTSNLIQSSDGKMQLDLTDKQFRVYDDDNLRAIFGEV